MARRLTVPKKTISATPDPATDYARAVVTGSVAAGPYVRQACQRHLSDLEDGSKRGLTWRPEIAARVIGFFRDILRLADGEFAGKPFVLSDFQCFIVGSLFGWYGDDGYRRFRTAYIETGKGSGKSPLAAGIGLYCLTADGESGAEVYAAATTRDQAKVLYRDAVRMVEQSPSLASRIQKSGEREVFNLAFLATSSFFRTVSSEGRGLDGKRPHCVLIDEVHEHPTAEVVDKLRAGTKGRRQALIVEITNSGFDRTSVCWHHHEYSRQILAGEKRDDSWFAYVCALDDGDDPLSDPSCWPKANPNLGKSITEKYLAEQVREALGMPSKESIVRRLNFCQWVDAASPWISSDLWRASERDDLPPEFLDGRPVYGGIDLGGTKDLTALALVSPRDDGGFDAELRYWTPADTMAERGRRDGVPYLQWAADGTLIATPGRAVDYSFVAREIGDIAARVDLRVVAFDPYRIKYLEQDLDAEGVTVLLTPHGQGYYRAAESKLWMPRSVELLERAVLDGKLTIRMNPCLRWNSASAVLEADAKGNRIFTKRKSTGRIDGIVALAMALGAAEGGADEASPMVYVM